MLFRYSHLSDPVKRRQYDLLGSVNYGMEDTVVEKEEQEKDPMEGKIVVEEKELRREWGIFVGACLAAFALNWLISYSLEW